ncbi:hypothetical protein EDB80DRAFT_729131 [Ilyonectria destructans]|nr:hypothetical protein EDB80DRAFT_729131 [Ilyonectria destructans]
MPASIYPHDQHGRRFRHCGRPSERCGPVQLRQLLPVHRSRLRTLPTDWICALSGEEIEVDEPSLLAPQDAAAGSKSVLSEAVVQKGEGVTGGNYAKDMKSEEDARVLV